MRIELAGSMGSGKTTLARSLRKLGLAVVYEDLRTNPYLTIRQDSDDYEFLCQQTFVEQKIAGIERAVQMGIPAFVTDYSMAVEHAYVRHSLTAHPDWIDDLEARMVEGEKRTGRPDLIVNLNCSPETQLARIKARGRSFEQRYDRVSLRAINHEIQRQIDRASRPHGIDVLSFGTDSQKMEDIIRSITDHCANALGKPLFG